ncbi:hypothetical protein B0A52_02579 [Exophiala mesophila]|uniref:Transcription factor domain-containing protein n=1 Tax=Exophiala mesophila TaxID=212818 RepID=A0A438NDI1_EXOME|nr:hypothetical protein B0A52_02579 [Exophiala mesophila]
MSRQTLSMWTRFMTDDLRDGHCPSKFLARSLPVLIWSLLDVSNRILSSHASFRAEYLPAITNMIPMFSGLKNVVLACGASHKQFHTGNADLYEAGLNFYSQAVSDVGQALHLVDWKRDGFEDSVLLTVVLLYVHGIIFCGTRRDIRKHLDGAIQLMTLRCAQSRKAPISRPFDRIMWESILYQSFRQSVRNPFWKDYQPNDKFYQFAEEVLGSSGFSYMTDRESSPVIGFPLKLQKFIISVVRVSQSRVKPDVETLNDLESELQYWESMVIDEQVCADGGHPNYLLLNSSERAEAFNQHSTSLHILATSLLLHWIKNSHDVSDQPDCHLPPPIDSWQMDRALKIMTCTGSKQEWTRCYLGSWPALIFGYAASDLKSIEILRRDVQDRTTRMSSGEDLLVLDELELVWRQRGFTREK